MGVTIEGSGDVGALDRFVCRTPGAQATGHSVEAYDTVA
jgi:hypothetical protein